jgi:membrane-bound metal-dependent hydrolase YbcI (DUF457 family)
MPSPLGHALAGIAAAWAVDLVPGDRAARTAPAGASWLRRAGNGLTLTCAALAAAPDLDLLVDGYHRSVTHSVTAVAVVGLVSAIAAAGARLPVTRVAFMCAAAWGTHLLLDWLAVDRLYAPFGVQLLWPFSDTWFISRWDLFPGTERHNVFSAPSIRANTSTAIAELTLLLPIVVGLWLVRVKALAGLSAELSGGDHPPQ